MPRGVNQTSQATPAWLRGPTVSHSSPGTLALWTDGPRGRPADPGDFGPVSKGPWGRPTFPGVSGLCPRDRGMDHLSQATQVRVRGPAAYLLSRVTWACARCHAGSTSCPGGLRPGSRIPWCRPAVPGNSTQARRPAASTSCPGRLGPVSEGPRVRPAIPGHSRWGPCSRGVDQQSRATRACVRGPVRSTRCLWPFGPGTEGPRDRPADPRDLGPCPRSCGRPSVPGDSGPCPMSRWVDQLSWGSRAHVRGPAGSTTFPGDSGWSRGPAVSSKSPGRLGPVSDILQGRPAVPGDLGPGRTERGVEQASRATRANVREPTGSNSCPGRLGPIPEASRCRPDVPGDWRFGPKARGVDQLSWLTWVRLRGPAGSKGCPGGSGPFLKAHGVDQFSL